jgi:hypothetical protein
MGTRHPCPEADGKPELPTGAGKLGIISAHFLNPDPDPADFLQIPHPIHANLKIPQLYLKSFFTFPFFLW